MCCIILFGSFRGLHLAHLVESALLFGCVSVFAQEIEDMPNRSLCCCSCKCRKRPGRRVVCSNCENYVCPGVCLALGLERSTDCIPYALCRQCVKRGTTLNEDGIDRIHCDGLPWRPWTEAEDTPCYSMQDMIIAYVLRKYLHAYLLVFVCDGDSEEDDEESWTVV